MLDVCSHLYLGGVFARPPCVRRLACGVEILDVFDVGLLAPAAPAFERQRALYLLDAATLIHRLRTGWYGQCKVRMTRRWPIIPMLRQRISCPNRLPTTTSHDRQSAKRTLVCLPIPPSCQRGISHFIVSELMSPKPRPGVSTTRPRSGLGKLFPGGRDGLLAYINDPQTYPPSRVISYNDSWVLIHDMYPKSSVHLLLMPRDEKYYGQHPFDAFNDAEFLASAKIEVAKAESIVASELRRLYGQFSTTEKARIEAMDADDPPDELPAGRDWSKEVMTGIHANPSMNHLHIHILSKDRHSQTLRHRKHYNSFNTRFFVPLQDFPISMEDDRRHAGRYLSDDMKCWRCDKSFTNKFKKLKEHLEVELDEWKTE
jgi:aprataxin